MLCHVERSLGQAGGGFLSIDIFVVGGFRHRIRNGMKFRRQRCRINGIAEAVWKAEL